MKQRRLFIQIVSKYKKDRIKLSRKALFPRKLILYEKMLLNIFNLYEKLFLFCLYSF